MKALCTIWIPVVLAAGIAGFAGIEVAQTEKERVIGSYATPLEGRMRNQRHNAELAMKNVVGEIIPPGATFSFCEAAGTWTHDRGYAKAPVSFNGQLIDSWGGGVCQASTTLYNAALMAGMEIVERHRHRFAPSYVPPGRDAAVAYPRLDLKFRNPYPFPVQIRGEIVSNRIVMRLVGAGQPKSGVSVTQSILDWHEAREYIVGGGKTNSGRIRNSGKDGFEVVVWRQKDGRREMISHDSYPAMSRVIEYR